MTNAGAIHRLRSDILDRLAPKHRRRVEAKAAEEIMATTISFGAVHSPTASIVVLGWRSAPHLFGCLEALAGHATSVTFEIVIVLNEPTPELDETVSSRVNGAIIERTRVNFGFAGCVNQGAERANGEFIVLLNDDARVQPGWLDELVAGARNHPQAGAVGGLELASNGTIQESGAIVWDDGTITNVGRGLPTDARLYDFERRVEYCSASSILIRRDVWHALGGLDERYFPAYYEDVDLCLRMCRAGYEVWLQPTARITHFLSASTRGLYRSFLLERNRSVFVDAWSATLEERPPASPHDPLAITRAVWKGTDEPMSALLVVEAGTDTSAPEDAIKRLIETIRTLLAPSPVTIDVVLTGSARDALADQTMEPDVHVLDQGFAEASGADGPRYVALGVSAPTARYDDLKSDAERLLPGVPILLDAGYLRTEVFGHPDLSVRVALDAPYLVCESLGIAHNLERSDNEVVTVGELTVCLPRPRLEHPEMDTPEATDVHGSDARDRTRRAAVRGLLPLTEAELDAILRGESIAAEFITYLEAKASGSNAYIEQLEDQIEGLVSDIHKKNSLLRACEAELEYLAKETPNTMLDVLRGEIGSTQSSRTLRRST